MRVTTIPESWFFLDRAAPEGLQAQLRARIVAAILQRRFAPGAKLPSTRRLAGHLDVARITVALVYQDLIADGYLEARPRSGVFVAADPPGLIGAAGRPSESQVDWAARLQPEPQSPDVVQKPEDWRRHPYPFVFGQIDEALFPHAEWRDCARRALGRREFAEVAADSFARDDPLLVSHTLSHSLPARGVEAAHEELLITHGAQNALWLAVAVLAAGRPGLRVVVEDPCYPEMRAILRAARAECVPVPVDSDGLDPADLPAGVDLVCVTPSHQAPTGATLPEARRRALLARATAEDFLILEDDYDFEMSFLRPPSPALKARDPEGRVLYVGSYSKPLFPGLRLGFLVAAAPLIRAARRLRAAASRHPPGMTQRTAAHFLALGHYNAHVARLRRVFAERRVVMEQALRAAGFVLPDVSSHGGSSFWAAAPRGDSARLAERARDCGVLIEPGRAFFADGRATAHFRIAYSSVPADRIEAGIARLGLCVER
jgi:GntR family transcriptional regulator/MocR family aminotransferase